MLSHILYIIYVKLVTWLGLCSRSGFPVRAETASTCWVFALTYIMPILILVFESLIIQERTKVSHKVSQIRVQN